ncbi:unnamed protein product [Larinioides sclopetarius]|uniref:Uncharacterized protein n=1 Tax=Larinioides sclopetarius TaxID=280406 RepID=A0AAV2B7L4_9ARAC
MNIFNYIPAWNGATAFMSTNTGWRVMFEHPRSSSSLRLPSISASRHLLCSAWNFSCVFRWRRHLQAFGWSPTIGPPDQVLAPELSCIWKISEKTRKRRAISHSKICARLMLSAFLTSSCPTARSWIRLEIRR